MMDLKPIYSKSITNEIVKRISEALQQGEFKPGDKLKYNISYFLSYKRNFIKNKKECSKLNFLQHPLLNFYYPIIL